MRFLITTPPSVSHLRPALQLGEALQQAGHEVKIATAQAYQKQIERTGLQYVRAGLEWDMADLAGTLPEYETIPKAEREAWIFQNIFLKRAPQQMLADMVAVCQTWRPDVIINNFTDFSSVIASELSAIPYATYYFPCYWPRELLAMDFADSFERLRSTYNLTPDPSCMAFGRYLDLCFGLRDWGLPELGDPNEWPPTVRFISPIAPKAVGELPAWFAELPDQPTVLMQLGTMYNTLHPELFEMAIAAMQNTNINLIVLTVSDLLDQAYFGPQPQNIRIERFIPNPECLALLSRVALLINHGGGFSVMEALTAGLPLVLLPLAADQPWTAKGCIARGVAVPFPPQAYRDTLVGKVVDPTQLTPAMIYDAVQQALATPDYQVAAKKMQEEFHALPGLAYAVERLERLAYTQRPIVD